MAARRTLLYLASDVPVPVSSGARRRTFNWILHLAKRFDITLVAPVRRGHDYSLVDAIRPYCVHVETPFLRRYERDPRTWFARFRAEVRWLATGLPPEASFLQSGVPGAVVRRLVQASPFDVVFAERWGWAPDVLCAGSRLVLDAAALYAERVALALRLSRNPLRRLLARHVTARLMRREAEAVASASLVLTSDPSMRRRVRAVRGDDRALVLPSGLCTRYFTPRRTSIDPSCVLFWGSLSSPAHRDALVNLHREIMPVVRRRLRHAHVLAVGNAPIAELELQPDDRSLHWCGPLDDERVAIWHAAVAVLPLRFGAGSPQRLAQLLAMGIPVVATTVAARGLDIRSGEGLIIVPEGDDFATVLMTVLLDPSLREDLSRRGREVAQERLSLAATYERVSDLLARDVLPL